MNDAILQEISDFCRQGGLAESTFGRRAVNDGKLASRLRNGGRITTETLDRIRGFMASHRGKPALSRPLVIERSPALRAPMRSRGPVPIAHAAAPDRPAAQFPLLRQPAEISAVRQHLLGEVGGGEPRRARTRQHPSAPARGARVRRRRRRRLGADARDALDARPFPAHAVLRRSARRSASRTSASPCRRWRTASSSIRRPCWCSPISPMRMRRGSR